MLFDELRRFGRRTIGLLSVSRKQGGSKGKRRRKHGPHRTRQYRRNHGRNQFRAGRADLQTSRRTFLKGAGITLAGVAALGVAGCAPSGKNSSNATAEGSWDGEYDVIVAGAGIAGLTAAVTIAEEGDGASCLLLEKESKPNGNSPFCAGWQMYFEETEGPLNYLNHLIGDCTPQETIKAYVEETMHNLEWVLGLGAKEEWLDIYRPEPEETNEYAEYPDSHTVGYLLFKTEGDQPHHIHEFLMGLVEAHSDIIDYKTSTPIEALIRDDEGSVIGVVADGKRYRAKGGVIMCTGGFENDQKMLQDYTGVKGYPYAGQANTGDGHRICQKAGAGFWHMHGGATYWLSLRNLENTRFLSTLYSFTTKQHGITVGVNGRRFYQDFDGCSNFKKYALPGTDITRNVGYRHGITQFGGGMAHLPLPEKGWFVFDQAGLDAGACPKDKSEDPVADGWAVRADSIEELATLIEVPADELTKTVNQWNEFVERGEDLAFYRPADTLTPIAQAPYYAMLCVPALLNTDGGPIRNEKGEVCDPDGNAIPGLYSAGEFGSIWGHLYQGGGNVGECGAFGRISARNALTRLS